MKRDTIGKAKERSDGEGEKRNKGNEKRRKRERRTSKGKIKTNILLNKSMSC